MSDLIFYPSNWVYNASVHGLLRVLSQRPGTDIDRFLPDDGTVRIPHEDLDTILDPHNSEVFNELPELKPIGWLWVKATSVNRNPENLEGLSLVNKMVSSYFVGNKGLYVNLIQSKDDKVAFLNNWFQLSTMSDDASGLNCSFCGSHFQPDQDDKSYYTFFTSALSSLASSSPAGFPNLFFNGQPNLPICKQCRWPLICFHLTQQQEFFINTSSFKLNWHLNEALRTSKSTSKYRYRQLMDMLFADPRWGQGLNSWQRQGIELYTFNRKGEADRFFISNETARLFANQSANEAIRNLISSSSSNLLADLFTERYESLPIHLYYTLRQLCGGKGIGEYTMEPSDLLHVLNLYQVILRTQGRCQKVDIKTVYLKGLQAPLSLNENTDKNLILRLLELTRSNQQSEAYYLLLRKYLTKTVPFPDELIDVFSTQDPEEFKTGVFSYISGVSAKIKDEEA